MMNVQTCPDGLLCENGSTCTMIPENLGSYYCNCTTAVGYYAGLSCEFEAQMYCTFTEDPSSMWFCTNGGGCGYRVIDQKKQWNCECPDEYEGLVGNTTRRILSLSDTAAAAAADGFAH